MTISLRLGSMLQLLQDRNAQPRVLQTDNGLWRLRLNGLPLTMSKLHI